MALPAFPNPPTPEDMSSRRTEFGQLAWARSIASHQSDDGINQASFYLPSVPAAAGLSLLQTG